MIKEEFTYEDVDGNEISRTLYFNLNKKQVVELIESDMPKHLAALEDSDSIKDSVDMVEDFVKMSVGERLVNAKNQVVFLHYTEEQLKEWTGENFKTLMKANNLDEAIKHDDGTEYNELIFSFISNPDKFENFLNQLMPKELRQAIDKAGNADPRAMLKDHLPKQNSVPQGFAEPLNRGM